jgi:hypothetical protein
VRTKEIPGGDGDANPAGTTFGLANCNLFPRALWRMDQ